MMNIGDPFPTYRVPALIKGQLCSFTLSQMHGRRMFVCCISPLTELEFLLVNSQTRRFEEYDTTLLLLVSNDFPFSPSWGLAPKTLHIPLLADPLRRLSRRLGFSRSISSPRCESLLFDRKGRLEFRLIHDLNFRGLTMLLEILGMKRQQDIQSEPQKVSPMLCSATISP